MTQDHVRTFEKRGISCSPSGGLWLKHWRVVTRKDARKIRSIE